MKRATITFPDALEEKSGAYLYLQNQKRAKYEVRLASGPLELTVADEGDFIGEAGSGVGGNLERYLADDLYSDPPPRCAGRGRCSAAPTC